MKFKFDYKKPKVVAEIGCNHMGVLDTAKELIDFCKKTPSKVNLIEYNQVPNIPYQKSSKSSTQIFMDLLEKSKILVKLRKSRGEDIGAACGQLATQNKK